MSLIHKENKVFHFKIKNGFHYIIVYMERWVKLRGNLLFYFKSKDPVSLHVSNN